MIKMRILMMFLAVLLLGASCTSSGNPQESEATQPPAATEAPQQTAALPSVPMEKVQMLWEQCDMIDYIWYDLPISMSVDERGSIQRILRHIASNPAPLNPNCKPAGRIFFQVEGENELEADFYFSQGCTYFVFLVGGQPTYSNYMTEEGISYMNQNLQQVRTKIQ